MMPNSWVTVVNQELNTCLSAALRSISSEITPNRKSRAAKVHSFQDSSESLHLISRWVWKLGGQPLMTDENHKHSCLQGERNVVLAMC